MLHDVFMLLHCGQRKLSMMAVDGLVPIWCQDICNHYDDVVQLASVRGILQRKRNLANFQANNKENTKALCDGNPAVTSEYPKGHQNFRAMNIMGAKFT